jgi:predicted DNA-binding transcriptional regulator AlpA
MGRKFQDGVAYPHRMMGAEAGGRKSITRVANPQDSVAYAPRGMSRDEAARYVGVGTTKFDEMVTDGRMPRPKRVDGRVIWDRLRIEAAFSDLPEQGVANPLDRMLQSG